MSDLRMEQTGPSIGTLFANTVRDVRKGIMPLRTSAAVDLKVSFASVEVNSKGWSLIYVKQSETSATLKMEIATRIHTDGLSSPTTAELVAFVQGKLIETGSFDGPKNGKRTAAFDQAVERELAAYANVVSEAMRLEILSWQPPKTKFIGLLQILLGMPAGSWDGLYGSETENAFVIRGTDYSLSDF